MTFIEDIINLFLNLMEALIPQHIIKKAEGALYKIRNDLTHVHYLENDATNSKVIVLVV